MRSLPTIVALGLLLARCTHGSDVDVKLTPAIDRYCQIIPFAEGWRMQEFDDVIHQPLFYDHSSQYECRTSGIPGTTRYLISGTVLFGHLHYTINKYEVDLA